jgi:hypothetical protein
MLSRRFSRRTRAGILNTSCERYEIEQMRMTIKMTGGEHREVPIRYELPRSHASGHGNVESSFQLAGKPIWDQRTFSDRILLNQASR